MESPSANVLSVVMVLLYHSPNFRDKVLQAENSCPELRAAASVFRAIAGETDSEGNQGETAIKLAVQKILVQKNIIPNADQGVDVFEAFSFYLDRLNTAYEKHCAQAVKESGNLFSTFDIKMKNFTACNNCSNYNFLIESSTSIPITAKLGSVDAGIKQFQSPEKIEGYHCTECRSTTVIDKGTAVHSTPDVFMVLVNRFQFCYETFTKQKVTEKVHFDLRLNLDKMGVKTGKQYELFAVIIHLGTATYGHNHILVRGKLGQPSDQNQDSADLSPIDAWSDCLPTPENAHLFRGWTKYGDYKISDASIADVARTIGPGALNPLAYIVCYKAVDPKSLPA